MDTAAAAETTVVAESAPTVADAPASDGGEEHHLCQADSSAGVDQRTNAVAAAVLLGLGAGTTLLWATRPPSWRSPAAVAIPWRRS